MPSDLEERPYKLYRAGSGEQKSEERPYKVYRAGPRGLKALLRGEEDIGLGPDGPGRDGGGRDRGTGRRFFGDRVTWKRGILFVLGAIVFWLLLSLVLFLVSAQINKGQIPDSAKAALTSGGNMLTGTDTVLVIGTDQRPKGSKEPGANTNDTGSRSDTLMLWRVGGGVSRRLSIPRDTVAEIPGHGANKINAAYAFGGPALTIRTVERFTGVRINHLIIVNLANFPKFIDAIGGIDVTTPRICSDISGGTKNGGFSLYLSPGTHHLSGSQALTLARTRENKCNPAENDLTREARQQQILNAIKSKLTSPSIFFRLPWASWDAPETIRTDMGGFTLLGLFAGSEMGGSAPLQVLKPTGATTLPDGESALTVTPGAVHRAVNKLMNG